MLIKKITHKIYKFFSDFCQINGSPEIKVISQLLGLTILLHILTWIFFKNNIDLIWIHSKRVVTQKDLLLPSLDGGYLEHFQYIILFWNFLLATFIAYKNKFASFSFSLLYLFLFISNSLSLQDVFIKKAVLPEILNDSISSQIFLREKDFYEFLYWFIVLLVFSLILRLDYDNLKKNLKSYFHKNIFLLINLSFFSLFIDTINANMGRWASVFSNKILFYFFNNILRTVFYYIEEVGEISIITLLFIYLLVFSTKNQKN